MGLQVFRPMCGTNPSVLVSGPVLPVLSMPCRCLDRIGKVKASSGPAWSANTSNVGLVTGHQLLTESQALHGKLWQAQA